MSGKKFLNPVLKIVLCALSMAVLAYYLYPSISSGKMDGETVLRMVVFFGFTYLLVQSIRDMGSPTGPADS